RIERAGLSGRVTGSAGPPGAGRRSAGGDSRGGGQVRSNLSGEHHGPRPGPRARAGRDGPPAAWGRGGPARRGRRGGGGAGAGRSGHRVPHGPPGVSGRRAPSSFAVSRVGGSTRDVVPGSVARPVRPNAPAEGQPVPEGRAAGGGEGRWPGEAYGWSTTGRGG